MSKVYITYEETPYHPGKYMVRLVHNNLPLTSTNGSYNVLLARLMNLSYADYLRMCRDLYGAEIIGKNKLYPVAYFSGETEKLKELVKLLNKRVELALKHKGEKV